MGEVNGLAEQLKNARPDLSEEQADNVLESFLKDHSTDYGVSLDTLFFWADSMYPKKDPITCEEATEAPDPVVKCLNCGYSFKLAEVYHDELGAFTSCEQCKGSFDVDIPTQLTVFDEEAQGRAGGAHE